MNLTARSYTLAVVIVALGLVGEWGPAIYAGLWKLPAAAMVILLWLERQTARRQQLRLRRDVPRETFLGRAFDSRLVIHNAGTLAPRMEVLDVLPASVAEEPELQATQLVANGEVSVCWPLTPVEPGKLRLNSVRARLRGRFGLAAWPRNFSVPTEIRVIPDRLHQHDFYLASQRGGSESNRLAMGSGQELLGLRDYQPGDPLHRIDWKATARSGRTTVRLMTEDQHLEVVIAVDAGRTSAMQAGHMTRLGHYTNVAARLAEKALLNGDRVSLVNFSDRVIHIERQQRGPGGLRKLRARLEALRPERHESNPLSAVMEVRRLVHHRSLVVILTDLDDADASGQLVQAVRMLRPRHLPLVASILDEETLAMQYQPARSWLDPYRGLAALETLQEWQHTRLQLEHFGVPVVMAHADRLDATILGSYDQLRARHQI